MCVKYSVINNASVKTVKVVRSLTPEMMHHVQATDLREKSTNSLLILLTKLNGSSPAQHNNKNITVHLSISSTSAFHFHSEFFVFCDCF